MLNMSTCLLPSMSDGWDDEEYSSPIQQPRAWEQEHESAPTPLLQRDSGSSPELKFWEEDELPLPFWTLDQPLSSPKRVMPSVQSKPLSLTKRVCFLCGNKQVSKTKGFWRKPKPEFYPGGWPVGDDDHAWLDHKCWAIARRVPGITKEERDTRARPRRRGQRMRTVKK